jgi:hypothetical protein
MKVLDKLRRQEGAVLFEEDAVKSNENISEVQIDRLYCSGREIHKDKNGWHVHCTKDNMEAYFSKSDISRAAKDRVDNDTYMKMYSEVLKKSSNFDGIQLMDAQRKLDYFETEHPNMTASNSKSFPIHCPLCDATYWIDVTIKREEIEIADKIPTPLEFLLTKELNTPESAGWITRATGHKADEVIWYLREIEKTKKALDEKPAEIKGYLENIKREVGTEEFSTYINEILSVVSADVHNLIGELSKIQRSFVDTIYRTMYPAVGRYKLEDAHPSIARAILTTHGYSEEIRTHEIVKRR